MPPKNNPLRLNPLQLKTLCLLQHLASIPGASEPDAETGGTTVTRFPHAHGDHFHVGDAVVMGRDATGLHNEGVWKALERKGLAKGTFPVQITVTPEGLEYATGMADKILHRSDH